MTGREKHRSDRRQHTIRQGIFISGRQPGQLVFHRVGPAFFRPAAVPSCLTPYPLLLVYKKFLLLCIKLFEKLITN